MRPVGRRSHSLDRLAGLAGLVALAGCSLEQLTPRSPASILASAVVSLENNALAALVRGEVVGADSVVVRYGIAGAPLDSVTHAVVPSGASLVVPVLGLLPATEYELALIAYSLDASIEGPRLSIRTRALPADIPTYSASGVDPTPGYVAFAAGSYGLVIDNTGRVVWYHKFAEGPGLNFMPLPTGQYAARPTPRAGLRASWIVIDPLGDTTRTFGCVGDLEPRFHDVIYMRDGSYWIMCDEVRTMDLSAHGGRHQARVIGTQVQLVSASGNLVASWSPFDHLDVTDLDAAALRADPLNWTHGNALTLDIDGRVVVSFRNLHTVLKIDASTNAIVWRFGGRHSDFALADGRPPFASQHGARFTAAGDLLVLDNLGEPHGSRVERYSFSPVTGEARLVASYGTGSGVVALLGGTTQPLRAGRVLVAYGNGGRVEEYDATGAVVWRIDGNPGYVFRAQRISSLYRPGADNAR